MALTLSAFTTSPKGVNPRWQRLDAETVRQRLAPLGLPATFVLAVGSDHPRKNLPRLIAAVAELRGEGLPEVELVFVGPRGRGAPAIDEAIRSLWAEVGSATLATSTTSRSTRCTCRGRRGVPVALRGLWPPRAGGPGMRRDPRDQQLDIPARALRRRGHPGRPWKHGCDKRRAAQSIDRTRASQTTARRRPEARGRVHLGVRLPKRRLRSIGRLCVRRGDRTRANPALADCDQHTGQQQHPLGKQAYGRCPGKEPTQSIAIEWVERRLACPAAVAGQAQDLAAVVAWQPMDERQQRVRIEREPGVGRADEDAATRANHLGNEPILIGPRPDVLDHGVRETDIELAIRERQLPSVGNDQFDRRVVVLECLHRFDADTAVMRSGQG